MADNTQSSSDERKRKTESPSSTTGSSRSSNKRVKTDSVSSPEGRSGGDSKKETTSSASIIEGCDDKRIEEEKKIINCQIYYEFHDRKICNYGTVGNISTGDGHSGEMVANICTCQYEDKQQEEMAKYLQAWTEGMVETAAFKKVMEMLNNGTTWITIKGSPGEGKTTVAYMALRELQKSGRQVFQARSPEEFTGIIETCSRPVILLDDLFGQLEFDETAWMKWKYVFHKVLDLKEHKSHQHEGTKKEKDKVTVLLVGRNYVFNPVSVQIGRLYNIITQDSHVVDMSHSVERPPGEKHRIWDAIVGPSEISMPWESISDISEFGGGHGFPHVCRLYVSIYQKNPNISAENFFKAPLTFLNETIALFLENDSKLNLFKEMIAREGIVTERDLQVNNYELMKMAKELLGTYLRMENGYYVFDHPSIYDSVAFNMCKYHSLFVIQKCKLSFIKERLRLEPSCEEVSVPFSECTDLVMYVSQSCVTDLAKRFADDLSNTENWFLVLSHQACTQEVFVKEMMSQLTIPLSELVNMTDNSNYGLPTSFFSYLASSKSIQLLKYIDHHTDIQLTQDNIDGVLYGVYSYAASDVLLYLQQSDRHIVNINAKYGRMKKSSLMIAAQTRDSQFVHKILSCRLDLNARDAGDQTALHYLCAEGLVSAVSHVIDKGCDVNVINIDGDSPLSLACDYKHEDVVTLLLNRGAKIGERELSSAMYSANVHICKALFDKVNRLEDFLDVIYDAIDNADDYVSLFHILTGLLRNQIDKETFSGVLNRYLWMSFQFDDVALLNPLLDMGYSVKEMYNGRTPLQLLIDRMRGADLNAEDKQDRTLLQMACEYGSSECGQLLIDRGADVNVENEKYRTPLHMACEKGSSKWVQLLIDRGADVNVKDEQNRSPLHMACEKGSSKCAQLLIDSGADVNIGDEQNRSPLHMACEKGSSECVQLLIDRAADMNVEDEQNRSPLHMACEKGSSKCVQLLIDRGADVNVEDEQNRSPLHMACEKGSSECVQLLINHGADVNVEDKLNRTPLIFSILSSSFKHIEMFELLRKVGADMSAVLNYRSDGGTVLHAVIKQDDWTLKQKINVLVKAGLDVNGQTDHGQTPLHLAVYHESGYGSVYNSLTGISVCQTLISHGADVTIQDTEGNTPLHLLSRVDSHTETREGANLLCGPAFSYKDIYSQAVKLLVDHGADVNKLNNEGQPALRGWMKKLFHGEELEFVPDSHIVLSGTTSEVL